MHSPLVDVPTLEGWLTESSPPLLFDCRARLNDTGAGRAAWREARLPGADHLDLDRDLSAPMREDGVGGRHPLPSAERFAETLRTHAVEPDRRVVVYDDTGGQIAAARAWWMLRWAGHRNVHLLDGGWQAWCEAGLPVDHGEPDATVVASDWQPTFDDSMIASADEVASGQAVLLDARAPERFRGEVEPLDPIAGHIPRARSLPSSATLGSTGRWRDAAALRALLPEGEDVIGYCGSGVSACQLILAHAIAGLPLPRLYPGSWSEWSRTPGRPVATGD
ncbi:sulfurtransferase [Halotalea alkalilenta]|uniref:sulfurtransferase n=1 Tax=Halotalea alkalilenta TaxID=376489 RepID=UPI000484CD08|nr:sulfurtransferase [Halotalea alkalilenta]